MNINWWSIGFLKTTYQPATDHLPTEQTIHQPIDQQPTATNIKTNNQQTLRKLRIRYYLTNPKWVPDEYEDAL